MLRPDDAVGALGKYEDVGVADDYGGVDASDVGEGSPGLEVGGVLDAVHFPALAGDGEAKTRGGEAHVGDFWRRREDGVDDGAPAGDLCAEVCRAAAVLDGVYQDFAVLAIGTVGNAIDRYKQGARIGIAGGGRRKKAADDVRRGGGVFVAAGGNVVRGHEAVGLRLPGGIPFHI